MSREFPPALFAFFVGLFLVAVFGTAHAAGGSCPSAANMDGGVYAAPTSCYYVDFVNGSDTNTGTDESRPWQHAIGMTGCSGTCGSTTLTGGNGVIFKGGVTWDYSIWPWSLTSGSGGGDLYGGCTGSSCIYYGVDKSWYAGSSWTRPVLSGGDWSNPGTNTVCRYDMNSSSNSMVKAINTKNFIFDNFEISGMCLQSSASNDSSMINNGGGGAGNNTFENIYFHRVAWSSSVNTASYLAVYSGSSNTGVHFTYNVVDFTDSGATSTYTNGGQGYYSGEVLRGGFVYYDHNVIYNVDDASDINPVSVNNNYFFNAAAQVNNGSIHPHIGNDGGCAATTTWYNNVIDTLWSGQGQGFADNTCTYYIFNNVVSNSAVGGNLWFMGGTHTTQTFYFFNNTMECGADGGSVGDACSRDNGANIYVYNNHYVTAAGSAVHECGNNQSCNTWNTNAGMTANATFNSVPAWPIQELVNQSKATANGQGYTYRQNYQFSPTSAGSATVGVGANKTAYCNAIASSNAATASADASACQHDTTYAVTYDQTNHVAVASSKVPNARPTTGAWDVGAYMFGSSSTPNPPNGLVAIVQ